MSRSRPRPSPTPDDPPLERYTLRQIQADLFGPLPANPAPRPGAAGPGPASPPAEALTGAVELPPALRQLLAAGGAARRAAFSPPPRPGQIVAVDAIRDARGNRLRELARRVAVMLDAPVPGGPWRGWLAGPEDIHLTPDDILLDDIDGPADPLARRVQGWNPVLLPVAAMGAVLAEPDARRLAALRRHDGDAVPPTAQQRRYRWLYTCLADEISAAAVDLAVPLRRVVARLRRQLADNGAGLFGLELAGAPSAVTVVWPGWRLSLELTGDGAGWLRFEVVDPALRLELDGAPWEAPTLARRVAPGEALDIVLRRAEAGGLRLRLGPVDRD